MDLFNAILSSTGGGAKAEIARRLGIGEDDAENVLAKVAPALGRGLAGQSGSATGLGGLLHALKSGNHQRYVDDPAQAGEAGGIDEGNKILGHILGSKDVSRQLASRVSEQTGVGTDVIKQMLPMVATLAMGALSKQSLQSDDDEQAQGLLSSFLDANNDGSAVDDLLGMAGKLFGR